MKKFLLAMIMVLFFAFNVHATTVTTGDEGPYGIGHWIMLEDVTADWHWETDLKKPNDTNTYIQIGFILFIPGAANDYLSVKNGADTGPEIFPSVPCADTTDAKIIYYNGAYADPYIDFSACTLNAGHKVIIYYW